MHYTYQLHAVELAMEFYTLDLMAAVTDTWGCEIEWTNPGQSAMRRIIKDRYNSYKEKLAELFLDYLTLACMGEGRHAQNSCSHVIPELSKEPGSVYNRTYVYSMHTHYDRTCMLETLVDLFGGEWSSNNFGGESWERIAGTALDFATGKDPATVFIDRIWDLRHNGGYLFDKNTECFQGVKFWESHHDLKSFLDTKRDSAYLFASPHIVKVSRKTKEIFESNRKLFKPSDFFVLEVGFTEFEGVYKYEPVKWGTQFVELEENYSYNEYNPEDAVDERTLSNGTFRKNCEVPLRCTKENNDNEQEKETNQMVSGQA